jgi:Phosphodiester glycosidase
MTEPDTTSPTRKRRWVIWIAIFVLFASAFALFNYAGQTDWVPQLVDAARNLPFIGPDRVATMENVFYAGQDALNQFIYDHTHGPIIVAAGPMSSPTAGDEAKLSGPSLAITPPGRAAVQAAPPTPSPPSPTTPTAAYRPPAPLSPIILSDPQLGEGVWSTSNMPLGDQPEPPLWHTFFRPDPERPYARADLVWIDLRKTELTLVQGTVEPRPVDGVKGTGQIPIAVQDGGKLLAAWNGGFLTLHGGYGMMVDRRLIAPPRDGFGVLAQYENGSVRIGVWGRDISMTPDLVSFRQNGPILIDGGVVNQDATLTWGRSVSGGTRIWRSGIGLTADGRLIYGIGDSLSAQTLGEAMRQAGAVEAIELDVNAWHAFFFTYSLTPEGPVAAKLDSSIPGPSQLYLRPYGRDFMYLTLK